MINTNERTGTLVFHLLAISCFLLYVLLRFILIFYPQPNIGGVEINVIYFVQRLLDGQPLYTDPEASPYAIAQYSPLYYYIVAAIGKLTATSADMVGEIYVISRAVSLALNFAYLFIVYRIARDVFSVPVRRSLYILIFSFIFLEITSYGRPDSLNHFMFILTLYVFMRAVQTGDKEVNNNRLIILAAVFSSLALFSKQISFILPLLIGLWLFLQKQVVKLILFCSFYLGVLGLLLLTLYLTGTDFTAAYKNLIGGIDNGIGLHWFRTVIMPDFYYSFGLLFICCGAGVFFLLVKEKSPLLRFTLLAFVTLFIFFNTVALKFGSNTGYYTEWWTLLFILIAFYWPLLTGKISLIHRKIPAMLVSGVLFMKLLLLGKPVNEIFITRTFSKGNAEYVVQEDFARTFLQRLQPGDKFVFFCNYYTAYYYLGSFLFRHAVMPQMDIVMLASYPRHKYNYENFLTNLKNGSFKWMIMRATDPQKQFFDLQLHQYELIESKNGFNLYQYKPQ